MVELIVVIILIGIISTVAVSRFFDRAPFESAAWADQVASMLRHGQKVAIAQNRPVFVLLQQDRVALCFTGAAACPAAQQVSAPSGANSDSRATRNLCARPDWMCEGRPDDVAMTVPGAWIAFDALGRASSPGNAALRIVVGDAAGTAGTATGNVTRTITVETETGYVD